MGIMFYVFLCVFFLLEKDTNLVKFRDYKEYTLRVYCHSLHPPLLLRTKLLLHRFSVCECAL